MGSYPRARKPPGVTINMISRERSAIIARCERTRIEHGRIVFLRRNFMWQEITRMGKVKELPYSHIASAG